MYAVPDNGNTETYVMPGNQINQHLGSPTFENIETMANEATSEYVVDPSMYYPAASGYGYYCTGLESPNEWDVQNTNIGHGTDAHYAGAPNENMPYVYYTPGYGYGDSSFNPYNQYIPSGMTGADGSSAGTIAYYVSPYTDGDYLNVINSATVANNSMDTILDVGPSTTHGVHDSSGRRALPPTQPTMSMGPPKAASSQANIVSVAAESSKIKAGTAKSPVLNRSNGSDASVHGVMHHISPTANIPGLLQPVGKLLPQTNHFNSSYPRDDGLLNPVSRVNGQAVLNDPWSKYYYRQALTDLNGNPDPLSEQNRGPRTNKSKNQLTVKAYTNKAGERNAEGYIVISADQYNKGDFPVDYVNGKFFVIKSYSEDDVHKSIKYSVWSSTPNGNKKLNSAYEDAQKIAAGKPRGCPVFLFFSVNASGQFCGVAEMVGPVDFGNDMDFWQQDKWSGSFPVKWHIIKDVPNGVFRHIILENNEYKSVTNSRDTQEIFQKPGLDMLKVFKNYSAKTSLLDDFMYYENRQRIMHEERAHFHRKSSAHVRSPHPQLKLNSLVDRSQKDVEMSAWVEKGAQSQLNKRIGLEKTGETDTEKKVSSAGGADESGFTVTKQSPSELKPSDAVSKLNIGSLSIHPKQIERNPAVSASAVVTEAVPETAAAPANAVTVAFNGVKKSSGMLTIGTIALDPKSLLRRMDGATKGGLEK